MVKHCSVTWSGWEEPSLVCRRVSAIPAAPEVCGAVWRRRFRARSGSLVGWEQDCCQDDNFWDRSSLTWENKEYTMLVTQAIAHCVKNIESNNGSAYGVTLQW
jgi:hypothetical protein